jgi:hypothetical protein
LVRTELFFIHIIVVGVVSRLEVVTRPARTVRIIPEFKHARERIKYQECHQEGTGVIGRTEKQGRVSIILTGLICQTIVLYYAFAINRSK